MAANASAIYTFTNLLGITPVVSETEKILIVIDTNLSFALQYDSNVSVFVR